MIRRIIKIDENKCNGCGLCASACHEGAIAMINGKAQLIRDDYCDGLGDCLPTCPTGAISFVEREAAAYDEEAVRAHMQAKQAQPLACGCPGTQSRILQKTEKNEAKLHTAASESQLQQWPVQIKLVPVSAPYFDSANLLVAADCSAYAYANFHNEFMRNKITLIGCPKLDEGDYSEKLTEILRNNNIKSLTIVRMQVPCCGGLENAVKIALHNSGKMIPWQIVVISPNGDIVE